MSAFDRSFLPPARLEFVVLGDTHFIVDTESYAIEFDSVRQWPARAAFALHCAAGLSADFTVHLGDLAEEPPAHEHHRVSRSRARDLLTDLGLDDARFAAGNMDIGDKPDPTMFTPPVSDATLGWYHREFGPSWYAFDTAGCHFVVVNSQILNSDLSATDEQARWLEADLAAHDGERLFLFLHMPPFFVAEDEPDTGFYNSVDEPARSWLTGLFRRHRVEAVFCGHTHFRAFHRVSHTRLYVCASTTTSRAGFYEAFSVAPPPEQGRNDPDKLGFYLVRVLDDGHRVHFVRTGGRIGPDPCDEGWSQLVTRTSVDLPASPLGLYLRTPLANESAGALAWPSVKRQRVRDDHPLLAAVELGARRVRVPVSDLTDPLQGPRLACLRDEGVAVTAVWVWSARVDLAAELLDLPWAPDAIEVQMPGVVVPPDDLLRGLERLPTHLDADLSLAPLLPHERVPGRYHPRGRLGFTAEELPALDARLCQAGAVVCRAVGFLDPTLPAWQAVRAFADRGALARVVGLDVALPLPADHATRGEVIAGGLCAAVLDPSCRLWLDPFVDLDRTNDRHEGLLDRLSNPRPAFHVARTLNTLLGSQASWSAEGDGPPFRLRSATRRLTVLTEAGQQAVAGGGALATVCDLTRGTTRTVGDSSARLQALSGCDYPCAILEHLTG